MSNAWNNAVNASAWGRAVALAREYQAGDATDHDLAESISELVFEVEGD